MMPNKPIPQVSHRLFAYGTLAPGRRNHHVVQHLQGVWEEGEVKGILHERGIGPTTGYPALDLDEQGPPIKGFLLTSADLPAYWPVLDEFEGTGYRRAKAAIRKQDGSTVDAYLYALDKDLIP
jgi:gamma-glutamylcyclotransferase (GGCT)/AIG2-like uncharacterized protein YtfP